MKSKLLSILFLVVGIFISNNVYAGSVAREIAGIAPDDSVFYIAGSGSDKLADDFNQTVLNDLINDTSVESFVEQVKAAIIPQIDLDNDFIEGVEFVKDIIEQTRILKDPVLAGAVVNKFDPKNEQIEGYLYVVSTGGKAKVEIFKDTIISSFEKYDMADELEVEIEKVRSVGKVIKFSKKDDDDADDDADDDNDYDEEPEPVICLTNIGDYMIFIVTAEGQEDAYLQKLAANIKAGPKPLNVFEGAEFDNDDIIAVYNYESYFNMIEQMVDAGGDEGKAFKNMFEKMNLKELGTLYYRISFKGKQMVLDVYGDQLGGSVFAGFFSQVDTKMLKAVPVDATGFSIFNYSFEKLFNMYYDMIAAIDENAIAELENGFNEFQDELGVNLGDGFLHNITGEVLVSFKSNAATGMMGSSSSCLMTVKDADLFAETIDQLVGFAKDELEGSPFPIKYNVNEQEGKQFRSIVVPQLAMFGLQPTIVKLDDEHIVISSSSLAASETVRLWAADGIENSILANPKYQKAVTDAPGELYSLQYTDSENFLKAMCTTMNAYWPMLTMVAAQKDIILPPMLPQVNYLFDELPPSVSWSSAVGETGVLSHIETDGVAFAAIGSAYAGVVTAVISPAMNKAKDQAKTVVCMSNLKIIGNAIHMYSLDNDDKFPDSLDMLDAYVNEDGGLKCPEHKYGYIYRGCDLAANCDSQMIMVYCIDHLKDGSGKIIVLCYDGHVESVTTERFYSMIENDNKLRTDLGLKTKSAEGIDGSESETESETKALPEF